MTEASKSLIKNILFNKWSWDDWIPTCKRMKLDSYFTQNFNSKLIRDINLRAKITKLSEENRSISLWSWVRQWFLRYKIESISNNRNNRKNKLVFNKIKNLCFKGQQKESKNAIHRMEKKNICKYVSDKGLVTRIYFLKTHINQQLKKFMSE